MDKVGCIDRKGDYRGRREAPYSMMLALTILMQRGDVSTAVSRATVMRVFHTWHMPAVSLQSSPWQHWIRDVWAVCRMELLSSESGQVRR